MTGEEQRARFERALHYGGDTHSVDDIVQLVRDGRAQFWSNAEGSILTELVSFPRFKAVRYWLISGKLQDCLALDEPISRWALDAGCTAGIASGRKGWGRAGGPYGWRLHGYDFVKDLRR
jgi:hypothetical protein